MPVMGHRSRTRFRAMVSISGFCMRMAFIMMGKAMRRPPEQRKSTSAARKVMRTLFTIIKGVNCSTVQNLEYQRWDDQRQCK